MTTEGPTRLDNDAETVADWLAVSGWTDGLPVWPPTPRRVAERVAASGLAADHVIAHLPPSRAGATVELLAANAAMAGCPPEAMGIVVSALEAISDPVFNLVGIQATTHPCGILVLAEGTVAGRAGIAGGEGCLGPAVGANVAVGRTIRLVLMNVGGARPGTTDRSTHGTPAKLSGCFTETLAQSPWPALAFDQGWVKDPAEGVVVALAAEGPHNIQDHRSVTAAGVLDTVGGALRAVGANNFIMSLNALESGVTSAWRPRPLVVFGPEHARTVADAGHSRPDVQRELWER